MANSTSITFIDMFNNLVFIKLIFISYWRKYNPSIVAPIEDYYLVVNNSCVLKI